MGLLADIGRSGVGEDLTGLWNVAHRNQVADQEMALRQQTLDEAKRRTDVAEQQVERKLRAAMFHDAIRSKNWKLANAMYPKVQKDFPELAGIDFTVEEEDGKIAPKVHNAPLGDGRTGSLWYDGTKWQMEAPKEKEQKAPTKLTYHKGDTEVSEFYEDGKLAKTVEAPRYKPPSDELTPAQKAREKEQIRKEQNTLSKEYTSRIAGLKKEFYTRQAKAKEDPQKYQPMDNAEWNERLNGIYDEFAPRFEAAGITEWKDAQKKQATATKQLDGKTAKTLLDEAGGDKDKARQLAKERGYTF